MWFFKDESGTALILLPWMGSSLGKFASPAAIWLGTLFRNLMIMAIMFGKQAPRSWKYLEECPKSLDICRYKLPQSVSFLMVVTRQGCWTKHIHNYFGPAMPKCRHASYKIGRWKEAHLQKEETDGSKWQDRPRKRSWRNISSVSFAIMFLPKFGDESLCQESLIEIFASQPQSFAELGASTELVDAVLPPEKNGYHYILLHYQPGAPHHKETWKIIFKS